MMLVVMVMMMMMYTWMESNVGAMTVISLSVMDGDDDDAVSVLCAQ